MTTKNTIAIAKRPQPKKELELLEVELKRIEVQERLRGMEHNQSFRPKSEEDRLNLEKISTLNFLLMAAVVDNERTLHRGARGYALIEIGDAETEFHGANVKE